MDVLLDVTVLRTTRGREIDAPASAEDLAAVARFFARHRAARAVALAQQKLEGFSELGAVLAQSEARFHGLLHEGGNPAALLAAQDQALKAGNVEAPAPDRLLFHSRGGTLQLVFSLEAREEGSLFQRIRVSVEAAGGRLFWGVLGSILAAQIMASPHFPTFGQPEPEYPRAYVCTIQGYVADSPQKLIDEQVDSLLFVDDGSEGYRPEVERWQICLVAAGYHPGAIDGRIGRKTRAAIEAFARDHGIGAPDTANRVFVRLLLSKTLDFHRTQLTSGR